MMKKLILPFFFILCTGPLFAQNYISLGGDVAGDDNYMDAKELTYSTNSSQDSLFIRIHTYNARGGDFGYAVTLDTNLNTQDGYSISQHNLKNQTPNTSMTYDVALYGYQNGFFPTVYTESYDGSGSPASINFSFDTTDTHFATFGIPLSEIGGNYDLNIVAFTGSFDISPVGAGPGDAIPDATYSSLRVSELGLTEKVTTSLSAYPNPVKDILYIESTNGKANLEITDLTGKKVMDIDLEQTESISISHLNQGIYLLRNKEIPSQVIKLFVEN